MALTSRKHPSGLWFISSSAAFFCISFGLVTSLLVLYLIHQLGFESKQAYALFGAFFSLIFGLPVFGGYLSSYFGFKRAMLWSNILLILGAGLLAIPGDHYLYLGLACFASGTGMYAPTYMTLQGKLYAREDTHREGAYTLSYVITNLGFLVASVSGGYIQRYFSYHMCFAIGAAVDLVPLGLFIFAIAPIRAHEEKSIAPLTRLSAPWAWFGMITSSLLMVGICCFLLKHANLNNFLLVVCAVLAIGSLSYLALTQKNKRDRARLWVFMGLSILSTGFWIVYSLEPSLLTVFIENNVNRNLWGHLIPPSVFYGLDPFFIILIGLVLGVLWVRLRERNKDLSLPFKFSLSLLSLVIALTLLGGLIGMHGKANLLNLWWIVLVYFFLTLSELLISPIGQAMVGRLAPEKLEGGLMGVWQMFCGASGAISGFLGQWVNVPDHASVSVTNPIYMRGFLEMAAGSLIFCIISFSLVPLIRRVISQAG